MFEIDFVIVFNAIKEQCFDLSTVIFGRKKGLLYLQTIMSYKWVSCRLSYQILRPDCKMFFEFLLQDSKWKHFRIWTVKHDLALLMNSTILCRVKIFWLPLNVVLLRDVQLLTLNVLRYVGASAGSNSQHLCSKIFFFFCNRYFLFFSLIQTSTLVNKS